MKTLTLVYSPDEEHVVVESMANRLLAQTTTSPAPQGWSWSSALHGVSQRSPDGISRFGMTQKMTEATLRAIAARIKTFDEKCAQEEYTDTDEVWDLLRGIRRDALRAARKRK